MTTKDKFIIACLLFLGSASAALAEDQSVLASSAVPVAVSSSTPKEEAKVEAPSIAVASTTNAVDAVPQLQTLVAAHEKEIASLNLFRDRWNKEMGPTLDQQNAADMNISSMTAKMAELKKANTKASKKEADRLKKDISLKNKELRNIKDELKAQRRKLSDELRGLSNEDQQAIKAAYQKVFSEIPH